MSGIPFLGPWANRLDEQAFYANGKRYPFDMELGNVRGAIPIHGFLTTTDHWQVVEAKADADVGVGDEPARVLPAAGVDEAVSVRAHDRDDLPPAERRARGRHARSRNMSAEPMPVAIGFHPYFQLTDSPRDEWTIVGRRADALAARAEQGADRRDASRSSSCFPIRRRSRCATTISTTCFGDLMRDASGPRR